MFSRLSQLARPKPLLAKRFFASAQVAPQQIVTAKQQEGASEDQNESENNLKFVRGEGNLR